MFIKRILGIPFMTGTSRELGKEAADAGVFIVAMRQQPEASRSIQRREEKKKQADGPGPREENMAGELGEGGAGAAWELA